MRRREFITLLSGVAATWPVAAHAQQPDRMRLVGVLETYFAESDSAAQSNIAAFRDALAKLGWTEGSLATVIATPNGSHSFVNWTQNGKVVSTSASYTFTMPSANVTLTAHFK